MTKADVESSEPKQPLKADIGSVSFMTLLQKEILDQAMSIRLHRE